MISIEKATAKESEDIGCKKENTIAIRFYKKLGYKKTSESIVELSRQQKLSFLRMEKVL